MTELRLTATGIRAGNWEAVLIAGDTPPALEVTLQERALAGLTLVPLPDRPGHWAVTVPIPAETLNEGVQTFLVRVAGQADILAHFTIMTGLALDDDLRAEVDLLRQQMDMLKRAFRRHCVETMG